jgi:hypothetical protein
VTRVPAGSLWVFTGHSVRSVSKSSLTAIESPLPEATPSCRRPQQALVPAPGSGWLAASKVPASDGAYRYILINRRSKAVSTGLITSSLAPTSPIGGLAQRVGRALGWCLRRRAAWLA